MKLKLKAACKPTETADELPEGSIVEMDEEGGKALIAAGKACEFTPDEEKKEQEKAVKGLRDQIAAQDKEIQIVKKSLATAEQKVADMSARFVPPTDVVPDSIKAMRDDPLLVGKAFQYIACKSIQAANPSDERLQRVLATKAIAGMSEGTAADGGDLVTEAISRIMGQVNAESAFLKDCSQLTLSDQANSMKVVYDASDWWNPSAAPLSTIATEGADLTPSKLQFGEVDVYPRVPNLLAVVTAELLEDVAGLEGQISRILPMKLAKILEGRAFLGTGASGAQGFQGILHSSALTQVSLQAIANLAAPTLAEIQGFPAQIVPAWRKNCKWYMSNALWQVIKGSSTFVSAANIQLQIIDLVNEKLLGYPVEIVEALPAATPIAFGDARQYTLVNGRGGQIMMFSREAYFTTNQLAWRLTKRVGGCLAAAKYSLADSSTVAAWCKFSLGGS